MGGSDVTAAVMRAGKRNYMGEGWYDRHVLPYLIDFACSMKVIRSQREKVVPRAQGLVLEVGLGTGLNAPHYDKSRVARVIGLDPATQMRRLASKRSARAGLPVEIISVSAERIPLDDRSIDTVLMTYSLCSIADPVAALREMLRVLRPKGKLIFCEHGRAPDASVRRWQNRLTPYWKMVTGGCHLNRDVPALLNQAGFRRTDIQSRYLPGPRPFTFNYWGEAWGV